MPIETTLSAMAPPLKTAVAEFIDRTAPGIPYAGIAIGDMTDSSLLSTVYPDRTGAGDLFQNACSPHLGANINISG